MLEKSVRELINYVDGNKNMIEYVKAKCGKNKNMMISRKGFFKINAEIMIKCEASMNLYG